jgi:uncharacterized membrane protein YjjP (DUF1212 family)
MLASGAAASDAVEAALDITRKAGLENVSADVTYTEFSLSYNPEKEFPYTRIEPIRGRTFDYGKLTDLSNLATQYGNGELATGQAMAEVRRIGSRRGPYPWWLTRLPPASPAPAARCSSAAVGWSPWRRLWPTSCWIKSSAC